MGSPDEKRKDGVSEATLDGKRTRRPYAKPKLLEYGSVAKLTQSNGSTTTEVAPKMKKCL
ncbi:MAG TPA: lasso RiPP family leader peptide-containing protein [Vicinamibacterales bacterium]|jgi:hypothetical protein|nr:lasso RiPP family leader peptide-containing protein [Vicinamibacterales bacterium]